MDNNPTTRCREYTEGWLGRRRNYVCRECHAKFQVDTLGSLPEVDKACPDCRRRTCVFTFISKKTGRETQIRASDVELATLRAKHISKNLTFKIPQPERSEAR